MVPLRHIANDIERGFVMVPQDPMILLGFINMKLRDFGMDLDALCEDLNVSRQDIEKTLATADYHYDAQHNQFV